LPVGPNYFSKNPTQYATFALQKISSNITITFAGSIPTEIWVKLPGLTNSMPNAINGWWNGTRNFDFATGLYPGVTGASSSCLSNINGSSYTLTFGSLSSASSTQNVILLRFGLTANQQITGFSIS